MSLSNQVLETALSEALSKKVKVTDRSGVGGGCINNTERLMTDQGTFFLKWNASKLEKLFQREAESLAQMRARKSTLKIPEVICYRDLKASTPGFLILEFLQPGPKVKDFDERLGRGLAALHRHSAERFGFSMDTYCGSNLQPNDWMESWVDFYRERRLGYQLQLARKKGLLNGAEQRRFTLLLDRLDTLLKSKERAPALIHGDLWSGNLHVTPSGEPALIDPAAYFAHREAEFGMMKLFGGFSSVVYRAYEESWPLESGAEERGPLYELYHLINHANLFGGHYVRQTMALVGRYTR